MKKPVKIERGTRHGFVGARVTERRKIEKRAARLLAMIERESAEVPRG